jgi:hypothetical protein
MYIGEQMKLTINTLEQLEFVLIPMIRDAQTTEDLEIIINLIDKYLNEDDDLRIN